MGRSLVAQGVLWDFPAVGAVGDGPSTKTVGRRSAQAATVNEGTGTKGQGPR